MQLKETYCQWKALTANSSFVQYLRAGESIDYWCWWLNSILWIKFHLFPGWNTWLSVAETAGCLPNNHSPLLPSQQNFHFITGGDVPGSKTTFPRLPCSQTWLVSHCVELPGKTSKGANSAGSLFFPHSSPPPSCLEHRYDQRWNWGHTSRLWSRMTGTWVPW